MEEALRTSLALGAAVEAALASPTIASLEALQQEWLGKVHPNHYHLHAVKHSLLQLYGRSKEKAEEAEKDAQHWRVSMKTDRRTDRQRYIDREIEMVIVMQRRINALIV